MFIDIKDFYAYNISVLEGVTSGIRSKSTIAVILTWLALNCETQTRVIPCLIYFICEVLNETLS